MAPLWSCEVCCEDFRDYTSTDIEGSPVCPPCVREMFDKALKFEHEYPPKWGTSLHPSEFNHIISKDFIDIYERKEIEYKTQPGRRIYCQHMVERAVAGDNSTGGTTQEPCGEFIGVRQRSSKSDMLVLGRCRTCKNATCMVCDDYSSDPATTLQHICTGKSSANELRAQAFVGLKRGKEWQQCPNRLCARRIELSAACNHITCTCGTGFCFICGKEADGDSEHWARKSGCPRYNHPDDIDAEYDEYEEDDDDDGSEDNDDILENVRGLFEVGSDETGVFPTTTTDTATPVALVVDDGAVELSIARVHSTGDRDRVLPPAGVEPLLAEEEGEEDLTLPETQEVELPRVIAWFPTETIFRDFRFLEHNEPTSAVSPNATEVMALSAYDAEAIASAYWEDDLSDEERGARELLGNNDYPDVSVEEADIDRTLWRLHVD